MKIISNVLLFFCVLILSCIIIIEIDNKKANYKEVNMLNRELDSAKEELIIKRENINTKEKELDNIINTIDYEKLKEIEKWKKDADEIERYLY